MNQTTPELKALFQKSVHAKTEKERGEYLTRYFQTLNKLKLNKQLNKGDLK